MLLRVQELWQCVYECTLYESQWCGWILSYLAKKTINHWNRNSSKSDPFKILYMNTIEKLMDKVVSNLLFVASIINEFNVRTNLQHFNTQNRNMHLYTIHLLMFSASCQEFM